MPYPQKYPLRTLSKQEERALSQIAKASSERVDTVRRAKAVLAVHAGEPFTVAAALSGFQSADSVSQLVERFNQQGLAALTIAAGRGRKPTYTSSQRQHILEHLRSTPNREQDQSATWSLRWLQRALRRHLLPRIGASTIRRVLHKAGYVFGRSRTWCRTGTAVRVRKAGVVTVHDSQAQEKQRLIELAYQIAELAGVELWCQDEAGPYQAIPQPGEDWHLQGKPSVQPHEYVRGGTAKLLTLFHPATGLLRAKGVLSAPNAVLHSWMQDQVQSILDQLDKQPLPVRVPLADDHPLMRTWHHWWWSYEDPKPAPI